MKAFAWQASHRLTSGIRYIGALAGSEKCRIAYVGGSLDYQNLGDEAMPLAYQRLFRGSTVIRYKPTCSIRPIRALWPFAAGVLAGGTVIGKAPVSAYKRCFDVLAKCFVFGTGVANPSFWSGRYDIKGRLDDWKGLLQTCGYIGVRGPYSAQILSDIGVKDVEVIGDPVIALADEQPISKEQVMTHSLGLNVGTSYGNIWGSEDTMFCEVVKLATIAKANSWKVEWFVVWPEDLKMTIDAAEASNTSSQIHTIYDDPVTYLRRVRPLSVFVGMKLHAVVLATCAYVPSVMLEYRPKCRDYMASIGQEDATLRSDRFRADEAWELINAWDSDRCRVSYALYRDIERLRCRQSQRAAEIEQGLLGLV